MTTWADTEFDDSDLDTPPPAGDGDGLDRPLLSCDWDGCNFETVSPAGLKRHQTRTHGAEPAGHAKRDTPPAEPAADTTTTATAAPEAPPRRPTKPRRGIVGWWRDKKREGRPATPTTSRTRTTRRQRINTSGDIARSYARLGGRLEYSPYYPAGRIMAYQAPAAGDILDRAVAGTIVDRVIVQPLWQSKEKWEPAFYLLAPPLLCIRIQSVRMRQQQLLADGDMDGARRLDRQVKWDVEMLAWVLRDSMVKLAPAMAEARARRAAEDEAIREAFPELDPTVDPVQALISQLFDPPAGSQEVPTDVHHNAADTSPPGE
ncbi:MAG TPA: hypothetical protein VKU91_00240 [Acidimicrobiales bacterium]|nr:hypothetical protein [Acidimicrobiales bacterium]